MRLRRAIRVFPPPGWVLATVLLALAGCASYSDSFSVIENDMAAQNFGAALQAFEKQRYPKRDQVVHLLNKAMLERMSGDFAASNRTFEAAKASMDELYGVSIREQALSFAINDATRSYTGETYEQVLVHLYTALNYLQLGDLIDARVEALQVDERLREITQKIPESRYTEDALARYLTGMIYEEMGERSDAMISYRQSYDAYRRYSEKYGVTVPNYLKHDLLRLSQQLGLSQVMRQYQKEFQIEHWMSAEELAQKGELVFILNDGLAPIKREQAATLVDPASGHIVRISLPYFETRFTPVSGARVAAGDVSAPAELAEDIGAIAVKDLEARMPAITARAVARAVVKAQMAKAARESARQQNQNNAGAAVAALAVEIAGLVTERADTRSWLTLPSRVYLARVPLPPGTYTVKVDLLGDYGQIVATQEHANITIRQGAKTYLSPHWIAPNVTTPRRPR
ncbi:MAG TPA: hypothetical protein VLB06_00795 [Sulfuricaulis sp.]|nr:hypothetical protein [Sulfuricaulis sp.]